jgi:hypothetical protein
MLNAQSRKERPSLKIAFYLAPLVIMIVLSVLLAQHPKSTEKWGIFSSVFLGIFIEAVPFLLLGTIASGLVEVFVDKDKLKNFFPKSKFLAALYGSFLGLVFPVCECGVVPLARRLFKKGLPIPTGVAFLLATPVINPIVLFSTYSAFGFGKVFFLRIAFSLMISLVLALVFSSAEKKEDVLRDSVVQASQENHIDYEHDHDHDHDHDSCEDDHCACHAHIACEDDHCHCHAHIGDDQGMPNSIWRKLRRVLEVCLDELFEIGRFLIIGAMIAALMQTFVPQSTLLSLGRGPLLSVLAMMILAFVLSICSTVDSFVALGFVNTFSLGSVLAFIVFGPVVDIKSILLYARVFKTRAVVWMVVIITLMSLVQSVFMNILGAG